jgi:hypothetical protein
MKNVLVVRGATNADELQSFGLPMAKRFAQADVVIGIDRAGRANAIKSREQLDVSFLDADSKFTDAASVIREIKEVYELRAKTGDVHLAHAFIGLWLFYWIGTGEKISPLPIEMMEMGDIEQFRESARGYIESDFGRNLGTGRMPNDGGTDTATA